MSDASLPHCAVCGEPEYACRCEDGLEAAATQALKLADEIAPLLAGKGPGVQGGALAELLARYLAGHWAETRAETKALRDYLLAEHMKCVISLIPGNEVLAERRKREQ